MYVLINFNYDEQTAEILGFGESAHSVIELFSLKYHKSFNEIVRHLKEDKSWEFSYSGYKMIHFNDLRADTEKLLRACDHDIAGYKITDIKEDTYNQVYFIGIINGVKVTFLSIGDIYK